MYFPRKPQCWRVFWIFPAVSREVKHALCRRLLPGNDWESLHSAELKECYERTHTDTTPHRASRTRRQMDLNRRHDDKWQDKQRPPLRSRLSPAKIWNLHERKTTGAVSRSWNKKTARITSRTSQRTAQHLDRQTLLLEERHTARTAHTG